MISLNASDLVMITITDLYFAFCQVEWRFGFVFMSWISILLLVQEQHHVRFHSDDPGRV